MFTRGLGAWLICLLAGYANAQAGNGAALTWTGRVGVASGLVYRGIDLDDGTPVPNLDVALEHDSGAYLHGWVTHVELPRPDYYGYYGYGGHDGMWQTLVDAGYHWRPLQNLTLTLAHNWYMYSDGQLGNDPDYREWALSAEYNAFLVADYAHSEKLWGRDIRQDVFSVSGLWPFTARLIGGATFGWVEQSGESDDGYRYLRLNLGLLWHAWSLQLQFHDSFGVGEYYEDSAARRKWVAAVDWHW